MLWCPVHVEESSTGSGIRPASRQADSGIDTNIPVANPVPATRLASIATGDSMDIAKRAVAEAAAAFARAFADAHDSTDRPFHLGLGSGSTATLFVEVFARSPREIREKTRCIPSSRAIAATAEGAGLTLAAFDADVSNCLDLLVDGADEVDPVGNMIKGGGGALLREKILASYSEHNLIMVDESKCVDALGGFGLPIEVVPFGAEAICAGSQGVLGRYDRDIRSVEIRRDAKGEPFVSDNGNFVLDVQFKSVDELPLLEIENWLSRAPGVVETGLFLGLVDDLFVADDDGTVNRRAHAPHDAATSEAARG